MDHRTLPINVPFDMEIEPVDYPQSASQEGELGFQGHVGVSNIADSTPQRPQADFSPHFPYIEYPFHCTPFGLSPDYCMFESVGIAAISETGFPSLKHQYTGPRIPTYSGASPQQREPPLATVLSFYEDPIPQTISPQDSGVYELSASPELPVAMDQYGSQTELFNDPLVGGDVPPSSGKSKPPYVCKKDGCTSQAKFARKADLLRHIHCVHDRRTTDLLPCPVNRCIRKGEDGFSRKDHLTAHLRSFHGYDIPKRGSISRTDSTST